MDGPNVNWSFHAKLSSLIEADHDMKLLNVGSCGLHTLHNSFKKGCGASGWEIDQFITSLFILLNDVSARQKDYDLWGVCWSRGCWPLSFGILLPSLAWECLCRSKSIFQEHDYDNLKHENYDTSKIFFFLYIFTWLTILFLLFWYPNSGIIVIRCFLL